MSNDGSGVSGIRIYLSFQQRFFSCMKLKASPFNMVGIGDKDRFLWRHLSFKVSLIVVLRSVCNLSLMGICNMIYSVAFT